MKVYVVIPNYDYQGFGEPIGIYTEYSEAEKHLNMRKPGIDVIIMEYIVNVTNSGILC